MVRSWNRRQWRGGLAVVLLLVLLTGLGVLLAVTGQAPGSPEARKSAKVRASIESARRSDPSRVDYKRLEERIALLLQDPDIVGLAVGTVERGQIHFLKGYGETSAGSGDTVTPDTIFRWASVSKGVASALVAKLAEEGRLSLDAPLSTMGTTLTVPGDLRNVTVADLLSHRTGLVRNAWDDRLEEGEDPKLLRAQLGSLPPYCPPGTCYAYQNIAYDAASEIVERLTGRSYAEVARERLFAPLGMTSTSIGRTALEASASWARPHRGGKRATTVNDSYYRVPAAGGINSSIHDLARWMLAQLGGAPAVLSPALLDTLHRPRVSTPPHGRRGAMDRALTDASYGLGWRSFRYAGHALVGHRGSVDGYGSLMLFDPVDRSGIVMLWNSNRYAAARLQLEFFDMLYGLPPTDWLEMKPRSGSITPVPARPAAR